MHFLAGKRDCSTCVVSGLLIPLFPQFCRNFQKNFYIVNFFYQSVGVSIIKDRKMICVPFHFSTLSTLENLFVAKFLFESDARRFIMKLKPSFVVGGMEYTWMGQFFKRP